MGGKNKRKKGTYNPHQRKEDARALQKEKEEETESQSSQSLDSMDSMKKWIDMMDDDELPHPNEDVFSSLNKNRLLEKLKHSGNIHEIIQLTKHDDAQVRLKATQCLCPCQVKKDFGTAYERLFEMVEDPDPLVRYQVLHNICDGSPKQYESRILEALNKFGRDPDKKIRKAQNKVLTSVLRGGTWNVM